MSLVTYSDSDDSVNDDATKQRHSSIPTRRVGLKRKRSLDHEQLSDLPPLPDSFHDLYTSTARVSTQDDPKLHSGRQRQIPHVDGHPSSSETNILTRILADVEAALPPDVRLQSLLKSELGAGLPLHVSLSRTLMLATHQRRSFTDALQTAIGESGVQPFSVTPDDLGWVANDEKNRWFLVVNVKKPTGDELNKLLKVSNRVVYSYGQPPLYTMQEESNPRVAMHTEYPRAGKRSGGKVVSSHYQTDVAKDPSNMYKDMSAHFHVSIAWTLEEPPVDLLHEAAHECVCEDALVHLKSYKYSSVDKSLISKYILKHYWNGFVELLPLWLAPNMVTLLGFFFILADIILLEIFIPDLVGPASPWLYYSFAFGVWMYSTMDNVDGKQARRTGQSSGLGELFDHGIDSLNCTLASLCETAAMGLGSSPKGVFTALIPCLPMFFSTWETYHTHTLYLGYFNGPTEGLIIACSMMIASGYYGPQIWTQPMTDLIDRPEIFGSASVVDVWIPVIFSTFLFIHLPACILNVAKARRAKNLPLAPVFVEWLPILVFTASCTGWLYSPYSTLMRDNRLVLFCLTMSFVFGRMTTKIILAHLTRQPFPLWTIMLFPLIGGAILGNLPRFGLPAVTASVELWYLRAYFVFALVVYFRWAFLVVNSICDYLGINCLTITPKSSAPPSSSSAKKNQKGTEEEKIANGGINSEALNGGFRSKGD
ncbi:MAG: hypothetical protein Q9186_004541 [Xanthomendoza sp. 1 TL-2023]